MEPLPQLSFVCPLLWQDMTGDERRKFCTQCGHHVQNLSLLAREERLALLERAKTERICGAYFVRLSGEMVTPEKPLTSQERKGVKQLTAAALSAGALVLAAGCTTTSNHAANNLPPSTPTVEKATAADPQGLEPKDEETLVMLTLGFIVCDPPKPPKNAPPSKR